MVFKRAALMGIAALAHMVSTSGPSIAQTAGSAAQVTVKIGIVNSLTGFLGAGGDQLQRGMELYAKLHRAELPPGVDVQLVTRDDKTDAATGKIVAEELINTEKVNILLGFMASPVAAAVATMSRDSKVPMIVANASGVEIPRMSPYVVRTSFTMWQVSLPLGKAAGQSFKTGYTLVPDYSAGHEAESAFVKGFTDSGGKMIGTGRFPPTAKEFTTFLQQIKDAKPDALFIFRPGSGPETTTLMRSIKSMGLPEQGIHVITMQNLVSEDDLPSMGDAPLGLITTGTYSGAGDRVANKSFLAAWKKEYGDHVPGFYSVGGWDGMAAAFDVIKKTKGVFNADEAIAVLRNHKNPDSPRGPIEIDPETRDIIQNIYLRTTEMKDGKLQNTELATVPNVKDPWKELNPPKP